MSQPIRFFRFRMLYGKYVTTILLIICLASAIIPIVSAQPLDTSVTSDTFDSLVEEYAELMLGGYEQDGFEEQIESLLAKAVALRDSSGSAEATYLAARMLYGYTETQGVLGVFRVLKESRDGLEKALTMDDRLLDGMPKALLGFYYVGVPRWPVSFGDREKGNRLLEEALAIDDQNLTNNYFYSYRFIMAEDYVSARQQLLKARSLEDPDTRWPKWQTLVLQQIDADLVKVEAKL